MTSEENDSKMKWQALNRSNCLDESAGALKLFLNWSESVCVYYFACLRNSIAISSLPPPKNGEVNSFLELT